jgi:SAM-dependent methyltransferase
MNATELTDLARIKQGARATWAAGDFPAVAKLTLWEVGPRLVNAVGIRSGDEVLDVACGTGNAAIRAAEVGATVTGVDLTPELFDAGRREAAAVGVSLRWVQGDAEELPFPANSFDVVLSTFGCMFAPRHAVAAARRTRRHYGLDAGRRHGQLLQNSRRVHAASAADRPAPGAVGQRAPRA